MKNFSTALKYCIFAVLFLTSIQANAGYRYLRLTPTGQVSAYDLFIQEIDWMVGATAYPTTHASAATAAAITATENTNSAWKAYDGTNIMWAPGVKPYPFSITCDMGVGVSIDPTEIKIAIEWSGRTMSSFSCEGSSDNSTWTTLYEVSGLKESDWTSNTTKSFVITPGSGSNDTEAPTVPTALTSSAITQNSFTLSWTASTDNEGVSGYDIYQGGILAGSSATTTFTMNATPSTTYSMTVKAKDAAGNRSAASQALAVTTPIAEFPSISGSDTNPGDMGDNALPGSFVQRILRVTVKSVSSTATPSTISEMVFNLGSTTNAQSIRSANLYFINQWGGVEYNSPFNLATVSDGKLTFTGSYVMNAMQDYTFDLFYNVADDVIDGNKLDAALETATIHGLVYTAAIGNGTKVRTIVNQGLTGTISVDNTLAADVARTSYRDFRTMIADLNKYGVGTGGLTVVVKDDQTFNYTKSQGLIILQTGRPGCPLVIKRSGTGTNAPIITKQKGGSYFSHLMTINGARYFTIDGLTFKGTEGDADSKYFTGLSFVATASQTLESVEIKNCTIDLDVVKDINTAEARFAGIGIRIANSFENSFEGSQKNIKIHDNKFLNLREGIRLERRSGKLENVEIYNNTITNCINNGIYVFSGDNKDVEGPVSVYGNEISGASFNLAGDYNGIWDLKGINVRNVVGNVKIYNNKVHDLANANAMSRIYGIAVHGNTTIAVSSIYNNMVWNLSSANSTNGDACNAITLENKGQFNIYYNTAVLSYSTSTTNTSRILQVLGQPQVEIINNLFVNNVQVSGTAKAAVLDMDPARLGNASDHNLYYAGTPGDKNFINYNGGKQSLADYQTQVAGKELNSITDVVPFIGVNNPHISADIITKLEGAGKSIATITTDIDGDTRNTILPDLGADEGNFTEYFLNHIPTIKSVPRPAPIYTTDGQQTVALSDISDGDPNKTQDVSVTVQSSNAAIIRIDALDYVANATTGTLKYTSIAPGSSTITIKVKDNGGIANNGKDSISVSFLVVAEDALLNNAPAINAVADVKAYTTELSNTITLSGIADGDRNKTQNLTLSAYSDKPTIVTNLQTNYVAGNSTASLTFKPGTPGTATIYVKVKDDGGRINNGIDSVIIPIKVEVRAPNGSGFIENFNDNKLTGWYGRGLSEENQVLKIIPEKSSAWEGFGFSFPEVSIKNAPFVSLKVKTNFDFNLSIAIGKLNGKIDNYPLRIETIGGSGAQEIVASTEFQEYSFDYTGLPTNALDSVSNIYIVLNPLTRDFGDAPNKAIYFDDFKIGDIASHTPAISSISDQIFTARASGSESRVAKFRNVNDGSTDNNPITITTSSSNPACILDPQVNYTSPKRTGSILLQPTVTAIGESMITVMVAAANTTEKLMKFKVKVVPNAAPTMKALPAMVIKKGEKVTVALTDIYDNNDESNQNIEITGKSLNALLIPTITVVHDSTDFTGSLSFTPSVNTPSGSVETIRVKLKDNGGISFGGIDTTLYTFNVAIYDEINKKPTFDSIAPKSVKALPGSYHLNLTGLSDGDSNTQNISFEVTASTDSVVTNLSVGNIVNGVASLDYNLTGKTGNTTITIKMSDDGGKAGNNGSQFIVRSFVLTSVPAPVTGLVMDYVPFVGSVATSGIANSQYNGQTEIMPDGTVHLSGIKLQQSFPACWFNLRTLTGGKEMDFSSAKYASFKFKGASTTKIEAPDVKPLDKTQIIFRLVDNIEPGQPFSGYDISKIVLEIPNDDIWHDVYLDFTGLFSKDVNGHQTDSTRISRLMVDINCFWFQQIKGDYYIKDMKLGDKAERPLLIPHPTLNNIPTQIIYKGQNAKPILLTGINDGAGKPTAVLTAITNKPNMITGLSMGAVVNGTALLSYTLDVSVADSAIVSVIANNKSVIGAVPDTIAFKVYVIDTAMVNNTTVNIDFSRTYQTVAGMGTMLSNSSDFTQVQQIKDLNITLMRFTATGEFEPVNDNADPNVTSYNNFRHETLPTDLIRNINENTNCHTFFYTPWSPANWMKQNKGDYPDPSAMWATNNKLKTEMYEEFAEYLVAICKTIKEKSGVELYAISLQNEPTFNEPYSSCQYTGEQFRDMLKIIGPRFEAENINTRIMMPEDIAIMLDWVTAKVNPVNADAEARKYLDIMAVHLYDPDGINAGGTGASRWNDLLNITKSTPAEGLWMTETSGFSNVWEGLMGKDYLSGKPQFFPGPLDFAGSIYTSFKAGNISGWTDFEGTAVKAANDLSGSVFKNYSAYITPGSVMVDAISSNSDILSLAFKNADNSVTAILLNKGQSPLKVTLKGQDVPRVYRTFTTQNYAPYNEGAKVTDGSIVLPPRSITTLYHTAGNLAPVINPLGNVTFDLTKGDSIITLTGIGYGEDQVNQSVTSVTATSANPTIANASVTYIANSSTAVLRISPVTFGTTLITVKVKDDGGKAGGGIDSTLMKFYVNITSSLNHIPTIQSILPFSILEDAESLIVNLTGISDGDNNTQDLQFTVTSSNEALVVNPIVNYVSGSNSAQLIFKPLANANGITNIKIIVSDNGGNETNNGNLLTSIEVPVTVTAVNDKPTIIAPISNATINAGVLKRFAITLDDGDDDAVQNLSYILSNGNPEIATATMVDNLNNTYTLNVRGVSGGTINLKFSVKDNGGILNAGIDSTSVEFNVTVVATGIDDIQSSALSLYPNPANDHVFVTLDNEYPESVVITDAYGRIVLKRNVANESNQFKLSISTLPQGLYFITVNSKSNSHTLKLVRR